MAICKFTFCLLKIFFLNIYFGLACSKSLFRSCRTASKAKNHLFMHLCSWGSLSLKAFQHIFIGARTSDSDRVQSDVQPARSLSVLSQVHYLTFLTFYPVHCISMLKVISNHKKKCTDDRCLIYCFMPLSTASKHGLQMRETGKTGASSSCTNLNLPQRPLRSPVSENGEQVRWWVTLF